MEFDVIGNHVRKTVQCDPENLGKEFFTYIDISSVDRETKQILTPQTIPTSQAPSRARKQVRKNDVIVSTVRPNLNTIARVPNWHDGDIASTGFCVLRADGISLESKYLFYCLQTDALISRLTKVATGAKYPAVSDSDILESEIPLPPLPEQQRIAAILEKADRLRRMRRYAQELSDSLRQSAFMKTFVEAEEAREWPLETVETLAKAGKNTIRTGPFGSQLFHAEFLEDGPIVVLGIDNVVQNRFVWEQQRFITEEKYQELKRYTVYPNDVLITIMGTCGKCAIAPADIPPTINTKHLCCITLDQSKCLPTYLQACFLMHPFVLKQLGIAGRGAIMTGLNMGIIKDLALPLPPMSLQLKFDQIVQRHNALHSLQREAARQAEHLFQTLLHRAFRGEL